MAEEKWKHKMQDFYGKISRQLEVPLSSAQVDDLEVYLDLLLKWNRRMNLVGKSDREQVRESLLVDSLFLADFLRRRPLVDTARIFDLGAGAGLPGIPLRVLWQDGTYVLVEVRQKRCVFMRTALAQLRPERTVVFEGRAENAAEYYAQAELVLSRAFMPWPKLLPFVEPLLAQGGRLVVLSNDPAPDSESLPQGWQLLRQADYPAAGHTRYFWELAPDS